MEIIERIYDETTRAGKRLYELCDVLNIRTSTMSTWHARKNDPPARYLKTIADFLGVSLDYLITGTEAPPRRYTTEEEDTLLECFRSLPDNEKWEYLGRIKQLAESHESKYLDKEKRSS